MAADHGEEAQPWFPVTDPDLDAPDGALVWRDGAHYERQGAEWVRVEPDHFDSSQPIPKETP